MGDYRNTLNLPRTDFPMRANLPQREPERLNRWEEEGLYGKIRAARKDSPKFVLHDGPPYANGHIHMGHALNKILKDIVLRYKSLKGYDCPYIPGWDCHGLPVEHRLFKELGKTKHEVDKIDFRKKAHSYALKYVDIQKKEFQRLGVLGRWQQPYLTLSPKYEAMLYVLFADLVKNGYVYRGRKPVHWCGSCETALAEAEVEYYEKTSPSVYVLFPLKARKGEYLLVWTTTPWTLYSNTAVAVNPELSYVSVLYGDKVFWIAESRRAAVSQILGVDLEVKSRKKGKDIVGKEYVHPFLERTSRVIDADFVSAEDGSGFVHIAPGHGYEDFLAGQRHNLPVIMPIDDKGRFSGTEDLPVLEGRSIKDANKIIIGILEERGVLLRHSEIEHSYPHCWRCKNPIVFRATYQWFLSIDHNGLRDELLKVINGVMWVPAAGRDRISAMVKDRPDWCLSRQRFWGLPIPVFYCKSCGEPLLDEDIIIRLSKLVEEKGSDVWFTDEVLSLVDGYRCRECSSSEFVPGEDIIDVWFESGGSFASVLELEEELKFPADLYLEGSDQHRGWFQSSLIPSTATRGIAPYKTVLTHGFVVDGQGRKMSKSLGNVISPQDILKKYGADILRLWVASADYQSDVRLSDEILKQMADAYRKIRNTFRYILGNLYDFDVDTDAVDFDSRLPIDRWAVDRTARLIKELDSAYDNYEFFKAFHRIYNFCNLDMSAFYMDILKDRLYVSAKDSLERRSAQTSLYEIGSALARIVSPILVFTADEVWEFLNGGGSVHLQEWPSLPTISEEERSEWDVLIDVRESVLKALEEEREKGLIGSSLEASVILYLPEPEYDVALKHRDYLKYIFITSDVEIEKADSRAIKVERAEGQKCARCWNYSKQLGLDNDYPDLCPRCTEVLKRK